ncbi:MAG: peroxidase, partial [Chloroflexi bacterium]
MRDLSHSVVVALILTIIALAVTTTPGDATTFAARTLDGGNNNLAHPAWGRAGTLYLRVAPANYADGISSMATGPSMRYVSNRVFNDVGQNIFSKDGVTQWGWVWGQFLDHDFGLRDERSAENAPIGFDQADPLEAFTNDLGVIGFARTPAAPGTGVDTPREQVNTLSSYIDASNVYGVDPNRLEWLRVGPVDGDMSNNGARLMLTANDFLPRVDARGDPSTAPAMDLMGPLVGTPDRAVVAGDV